MGAEPRRTARQLDDPYRVTHGDRDLVQLLLLLEDHLTEMERGHVESAAAFLTGKMLLAPSERHALRTLYLTAKRRTELPPGSR